MHVKNNYPLYDRNEIYNFVDSLIKYLKIDKDSQQGLELLAKSLKNEEIRKEKKLSKNEQKEYLKKIEITLKEGNEIDKLHLIQEITIFLFSLRDTKLFLPEISISHRDTLELQANKNYVFPIKLIKYRGNHKEYKFNEFIKIETENYTQKIKKKLIQVEIEDERTGNKQSIKKEIYIKILPN